MILIAKLSALLAILIASVTCRTNEFGLEVMDLMSHLSGAGFGWDFLADTSRFPLFNESFFENKRTNDGKYAIPDCLVAEDIKQVQYLEESDVIEKSNSYVSKFSQSMKYGGGLNLGIFSAGGSYSKDFSSMMDQQKSTKTVTTTTKYVDHKYSLLINSKCPLDKKFLAAISEIEFYVENGFDDLARYTAELLVREYGTHFLKKVKIGAILYIDNYLSDVYWRNYKTSTTIIKKSASASFAGIFKVGSSSTTVITDTEIDTYNRNIKKQTVSSIGGDYKPGMDVNQWASTIDNNLVTIDRESELIVNVLSPANFPNIKIETLIRIRDFVDKATGLYIRVNTRTGCTDQRSIMFDPTANHETGSELCAEQYKFGGTFAQTIYCNGYNPQGQCISSYYPCNEYHLQTRERSCPNGYKARTGFLSSNPRLNLTECYGISADKETGDVLFGGIYSSSTVNPLTGKKSCPEDFMAYNLFDCSKNVICLSLDPLRSVSGAIPFGGFVSTCIPSRSCPPDMEKIFINSYNGCDLYYCTKLDKKKPMPDLIELPLSSFPRKQYEKAQELRRRLKK